MQYIVLDMEWNQAQTQDKVIRKPIHLVGEIVQIGAVKLNENFQFADSFKVLISPCFYKKMNYRIARLTGITNSHLRSGLPFKQALEKFKSWCGEDFSFITWGGDDIPILRDNIRLHEMEDSWIPCCYDAQPIFDYQITKEHRQCSLTYAMEKLGEMPYKEHDALNDAVNTAIVCSHLDMKSAISQYGKFVKPPKAKVEQNYVGHIIKKSFSSRRAVLSDGECKSFVCPDCSESSYCGKWVHQSGDKYIALSKCRCGKSFFVRLIFRKNGDMTLRARRLIYPLDREHRDYYDKTVSKNSSSKQRKRRKNS